MNKVLEIARADAVRVPTDSSDESAWLVVAGLFEMLLGCFCLYLCSLLVGKVVAHYTVPTLTGLFVDVFFDDGPSGLWQPLVIYSVAAVAFLWLGIGLVRARRWAWSMTVAWSWVWLVLGAVLLPMFVFVHGPAIYAVMWGKAEPWGQSLGMQAAVTESFACLYLGVPGLLLFLCHDEPSRATCEWRDPQTRWTDRCPLPVLVASLLFATSALLMLSAIAHGGLVNVFGTDFSRGTGLTLIVLCSCVLAVLAWGTYKQKPAAWWGALLATVVGTAMMVVLFATTRLYDIYNTMGMPADQLRLMLDNEVAYTLPRWAPWLALAGCLGWLGYVIYVRRYFFSVEAPAPRKPLGT